MKHPNSNIGPTLRNMINALSVYAEDEDEPTREHPAPPSQTPLRFTPPGGFVAPAWQHEPVTKNVLRAVGLTPRPAPRSPR